MSNTIVLRLVLTADVRTRPWIAKELGLDIDQLQKDAQESNIKKALDEPKELAQKVDLEGTPMFLIGDRVIAGAPDDLFDQLKAKVAEVRQNGCASTC